ncbi:MAG: hypothetical protein MUE81_16985 [Thermoflexibacter sp.]|jgi:hypothetical protein|nr:hypothetical protein [Thermoflexibacter sp.]
MKNVILAILILALTINFTYSQDNLKVLKPKIGSVPNLSDSTQNNYKLRDQLGKNFDLMTEAEKNTYWAAVSKTEETKESPFDILGGSCSWYCGGDSYKQVASSTLKSTGSINYNASNAHDLSYKTAWVEGVQGDGIGEYLAYYFKNSCPRVTEIIVSNGYVKSDKAWKENSRVKTLKLYINDKPYAILNLMDTKADQSFELGEPVGRYQDGKDMILKFEILSTYKGDKYSDTAITEIFFDGIDVH